ncbi:ribosome-inactivating family protein [Streptomyces sp. NPDC001822]|uniref:ribosome-inactivating family protein n=1 Tax=Streptomyces sp. NPDC001822 TaxID=3364614 RepID=UPI00369E359A
MPLSSQLARLGQRKPVRLVSLFAALLIAAVSLISGIGPAKADTRGNVGHVWFDAVANPDQSAQARYRSFIESLRAAAGHTYRGSTSITQTDGGDTVPALIRVDVNLPPANGQAAHLRLWLSPGNLYLRGFTTQNNVTWSFNDFNLQATMNSLRNTSGGGLLPPANAQYGTLRHNSNYAQIENFAQTNRDALTFNYQGLWNSFFQLAYVDGPNNGTNPAATARSLLFMTQFVSEAARFHDVFGVMNDIASSRSATYHGIGDLQHSLENNWGPLSRFGVSITNGTSAAPVQVNATTRVTTWQDETRYVAMLLAPGNSG